MKSFIFLVSFIYTFTAPAAAKSSVLQKALDKYSKAVSLQMDLRKTDEKVILGTKSEAKGSLKYHSKKIRIDLEGEKKTEFYFGNKTLILVEYPDLDFNPNGGRKVTTLKKTIPTFVNSLMNLFSNPKGFNKDFSVISEKKDGDITWIELKPALKNLKNFNLKIDHKKNLITEIVFVDDVDTKTTIQLLNTVFNKKMNKTDFVFKKIKTDEEIAE